MNHNRLLLLALVPGCFLLPGSAHGLKGGETLYVAEDSVALQVMGTFSFTIPIPALARARAVRARERGARR
jgi:hypothetical protein